MSNPFWLSDAQMARLEPFFPKSHGKPRVDDRWVLSGIIYIHRNGVRWRDAPAVYGPHKTLYSRWKRWSEKGIFARMMVGLAAEHGEEKTVMIDATYLKAHRTATSMAAKKGWRGRLIGRTKGGMNTKLHAVGDSQGRPIDLFVTAGQVSDYIGVRALVGRLPNVKWLLGDRGHDADWFREALQDKEIRACIPGRKQRKTPVNHDKRGYKRRNRPSRDIAAKCTAGQRSRSCSLGSRIGGVWRLDTTDAPGCSTQQSRSRLSSSIGYES